MLQKLIEDVRQYHEQARLIVAGRLLASIDQYLATGQHAGRAEVKAAQALLGGELKASFDELRHRAAECSSTLDDWHSVRCWEGRRASCIFLVSPPSFLSTFWGFKVRETFPRFRGNYRLSCPVDSGATAVCANSEHIM